MKQRVTIDDVARAVGVSRQTVSRAINDKGEISPATQKKVMKAVRELAYRPSRVAQSLVTHRTFTIGLVVGDITNPFFPELARGVQDAAQEIGYNLFLCNTDGDPEQELSILQSLADQAVDGIIVYPTYDSRDNLTKFAAHYRPLVLINYAIEHPGVSRIMVDHYRGARLAVEYLVSRGHTAIGMLTGVLDPSPDRVRRIQGFRETLQSHQIPIVDDWIVPSRDPTFECGREAARDLLTDHPEVTAIFAYNDLLALGAIRACNDLGRRVPDDCAIIGFDDIRWAATSTPALTTIHVDKYDLGGQATNRVLEMLNNPKSAFPPIRLDVELVVRESA